MPAIASVRSHGPPIVVHERVVWERKPYREKGDGWMIQKKVLPILGTREGRNRLEDHGRYETLFACDGRL